MRTTNTAGDNAGIQLRRFLQDILEADRDWINQARTIAIRDDDRHMLAELDKLQARLTLMCQHADQLLSDFAVFHSELDRISKPFIGPEN